MKIQGWVAEHQIRALGEEKYSAWVCDFSVLLDLLSSLVQWGNKKNSLYKKHKRKLIFWLTCFREQINLGRMEGFPKYSR